jgi:hypothetical protein
MGHTVEAIWQWVLFHSIVFLRHPRRLLLLGVDRIRIDALLLETPGRRPSARRGRDARPRAR